MESEGPWAQSLFVKLDSSYTTGVSRIIDQNSNFSIYPNPASKEVTIDLSDVKGFYDKIVVFDNFGMEVFAEDVSPVLDKFCISTTGFTSGTYTITLLSDSSLVSKQIILVSH